jgi:hypothetical protein
MTDRLIGQHQRTTCRYGAPAQCCCEMSASVFRRDNTDRSLARSAWAVWTPGEGYCEVIYAPKAAAGLSLGFQPWAEWREVKEDYGRFLPRRGYRAQPRVSTLGTDPLSDAP